MNKYVLITLDLNSTVPRTIAFESDLDECTLNDIIDEFHYKNINGKRTFIRMSNNTFIFISNNIESFKLLPFDKWYEESLLVAPFGNKNAKNESDSFYDIIDVDQLAPTKRYYLKYLIWVVEGGCLVRKKYEYQFKSNKTVSTLVNLLIRASELYPEGKHIQLDDDTYIYVNKWFQLIDLYEYHEEKTSPSDAIKLEDIKL